MAFNPGPIIPGLSFYDRFEKWDYKYLKAFFEKMSFFSYMDNLLKNKMLFFV